MSQFVSSLAETDRVAASTQNQALADLLFLYREVLGKDLPWLGDLVRAKAPGRLPTVLTRGEVQRTGCSETIREVPSSIPSVDPAKELSISRSPDRPFPDIPDLSNAAANR